MGVPVEVIVCNVVAPNHVFLQQPTHPTFPSLERQNYHMRMCYSVENVPHLPRPIDGMVSEYMLSDSVFFMPPPMWWLEALCFQSVHASVHA